MLRPGGIADQPGHVADQKDDLMPEILKMLHLAQQNRVAQVQVGRGGIEAGLDAKRTAVGCGLLQALAQVFLANELGQAFLDVGELFVHRDGGSRAGKRRGHGPTMIAGSVLRLAEVAVAEGVRQQFTQLIGLLLALRVHQDDLDIAAKFP